MGRIRHSHYHIRHKARAHEKPGSFRIAVLADLHNRVYGSDTASLFEEILEEDCDAVLSAGDLVLMKGGRYAFDQALRLAGALARRLPVYVMDGNHEMRMARTAPAQYRRYEEILKKRGVVCLHNESADIDLNGVKLHISGLEPDYRCFRNRYHRSVSREEIHGLIGNRCEDRFNILLAHHPKYFPEYAGWGADLTLSGHLHGGIVRLPYLGGVISPDPELFPHFDHGLFADGDSRMIVSAGLGTHTINLRINNPSELVIADITVENNGY